MPLTNQFHVTSILIILLSPCMHSPGITPFDFHKKQTEILADVFFPHYSEIIAWRVKGCQKNLTKKKENETFYISSV